MRIMGLDASASSTGYAIYDTEIGDFILIDKIRTSKKKATPTMAKRIEYLCAELSQIMFWNCVDVVVTEDIFISNQPNQVASAISLAMVRGALQQLIYDLEYDGLHVIETKKMKKAVTGNGNANKEFTYNTVKELYKDSKVVMEALGDELISKNNAHKNEDMADAVGLVHAYRIDPSLAHIA